MAELLTKILALGGARPFVRELHRNSPTLQAINEEFPRACGELRLFSFFETQPMNYGIGKGLIVDKDSAVLNYGNERTAYLNANHRDVARFASRSDTAFVTVRNALATTVELLRNQHKSDTRAVLEDHKGLLEDMLGVSEAPEDMLGAVNSSFLEGSCEWFSQKQSYTRWRDTAYSELFWVQGKPGVGKSVLAGHVITDLRRCSSGKDCCFHFFVRSDKPKCTISYFLRSVAFQMAILHPEILKVLLENLKGWKDAKIGKADYNPIWRRLFANGILKVKLNSPQYWVIDGLDECKQAPELLLLLVKLQELWPLCILVTSRDSFRTTSSFRLRSQITEERISENDTRHDIRMLIDSRIGSIPARDKAMRDEMAHQIEEKSNGCFLWVDLVLGRLLKAQLSTEVRRILQSVPSDMNDLYQDILSSMSEEPAERHLAKAILRWTACSSRPMTTQELHAALELDLEDTVSDVSKSIATSCGHLVYIDAQFRVRLVHQTAREFLTDTTINSDFVIKKSTGHRLLASTCLKYLSGNEMRHHKSRKLSVGIATQSRSPFVDYAAVSLFDHVANAVEESQDLVPELTRFFESPNVLTWIEYLSANAGLSRLLQAGKTLGNLLKSGSHYGIIGLSKDTAILQNWATDLVRLVSKFGRQLQSSPDSIYSLIPPFCPTSSAIYKRFASPRGLHIVGSTESNWNDCSAMFSFGKGEILTAVVCSETHIALGTMQKKISIFNQSTYSKDRDIDTGEPVLLLAFGENGKLIASAGTKSLQIWSTDSGNLVTRLTTRARCIALSFVNGDSMLVAALRDNEFIYWDIHNDIHDMARWTVHPDIRDVLDFLTPTTASISITQGLIAVVYRANDILLWNFSDETLHDHLCREAGSRLRADSTMIGKATVLALAFSAAPESRSLAAGYGDGELVLYDTELGEVKSSMAGVNAQTMCSSPDGRTLATGDASGTIKIFDLENLSFLYRINFDSEFIAVRSLAITCDSHRLLDIRGKQCRVWEPVALLRQEADDANSDSLSISTSAQEFDFEGPMNVDYITAVGCSQGGEFAICGKDDGSVHIYRTSTGQQLQHLFQLRAAVSHLEVDETLGIVICTDQSSRVSGWRLANLPVAGWQARHIWDVYIDGAITHLLVNFRGQKALISTAETDTVVKFSPEAMSFSTSAWPGQRSSFFWAVHPTQANYLIYSEGKSAHIYCWEGWSRLTDDAISLPGTSLTSSLVGVESFFNCPYAITLYEDKVHRFTEARFWASQSISTGSLQATPSPEFSDAADQIDHIIGKYLDHLVYFARDGWIRSVSLVVPNLGNTETHFLVPTDWHGVNSKTLVQITAHGDIIFAKRSELVIIRRGIEFERQPSMSRTSSLSSNLFQGGGLQRTGIVQRPKIRGSRTVT
ncbi:hypothetical protein PG984_004154 [Apiospora sp. TS-2023a]